MDRDQYLWEGNRQLSDTKYYRKLQKPIFLDTIPLVQNIVNKLLFENVINTKQRIYLLGSTEPWSKLFYILPKIHKEQDKWSKPYHIPPGRPIMSDCNSQTYRTAEYIDYFLNPLSNKHASYIKRYLWLCKQNNKIIDSPILSPFYNGCWQPLYKHWHFRGFAYY